MAIAVFLAIVTAIAYGSNSVVIKLGMNREVNIYLGLAIRGGCAFPILAIISGFIYGWDNFFKHFETEFLLPIFLAGLFLFIGEMVFMYALTRFDIGLVLPMTSIYPFVTQFLLIVLGIEPYDITVLLGTLVIVLGVAIATRSLGKNDAQMTGTRAEAVGLGVLAAVAWGSSVVFLREILDLSYIQPVSVNAVQLLILAMIGLFMFFIRPSQVSEFLNSDRDYQYNTFKFMIFSGLLAWGIGTTAYYFSIEMIGASIATPIISTNPIAAIVLGYMLKLDGLNRQQVLGIVLSVIGAVIVIL